MRAIGLARAAARQAPLGALQRLAAPGSNAQSLWTASPRTSVGSRALAAKLPVASWPAASLGERRRPLATAAGEGEPRMSAAASQALGSIKDTLKKTQNIQLSRAQKRSFPGHIHRYKTKGGRPEFHNVDRNRHGRIFEPWHNFEIIITSSKNNCWITVLNKGWRYRTVFWSNAGNVGYRQAMKKTEQATQAIALNVARKLKRLGVTCAEVTFRKLMKVETCLQAFQTVGLQITRLTHQPRLPQGDPAKPRKQRRV